MAVLDLCDSEKHVSISPHIGFERLVDLLLLVWKQSLGHIRTNCSELVLGPFLPLALAQWVPWRKRFLELWWKVLLLRE